MNEIITSLQNPQVKLWRSLNKSRAERIKNGLFLAEGEHMASEALQSNKTRTLLIDSGVREKYAYLVDRAVHQGVPVQWMASHVMTALSDAKTPQGVIAVCPYSEENAHPTGNWLVALDGVQDPGNVGTILRTMDAAGFDALLLDEKTADPYSPKALRATMGAAFRIPCCRTVHLADTLRALARKGYAVVAGDLQGAPFFQRPQTGDKLVIVIGSEGQGISQPVREAVTLRLKLPMMGGAESLNAAVAGSIMMYDFLREKHFSGSDPHDSF